MFSGIEWEVSKQILDRKLGIKKEYNVKPPPCPGLTFKRTKEGWGVLLLHYSADPDMTGERLRRERSRYTSQAWWDLEMEMKSDALSGALVYPEFDENHHIIDPEQIPRELCCFSAIDPHPRTPHATLWIGIDRWNDVYVYRELWPSIVYGLNKTVRDDDIENKYTVQEYCEAIAQLEGNYIEWKHKGTDKMYGKYIRVKKGYRIPERGRAEREGEHIIRRFMDQAGKAFNATGHDASVAESLAQRYTRFGMACQDPYKIHKAGEDAIHDLLKPRHHDQYGNWPRLHISRNCPELKLELLRYRYETTPRYRDDKELKQTGVEARSHMIDLLRYLATADLRFNKDRVTRFEEVK